MSWGTNPGLNSEVKCTLSGSVRTKEGKLFDFFVSWVVSIFCLPSIHPIPFIEWRSEVKCWGWLTKMSADLLPTGKKPMALPLKSLNHVSRNCRDLYASMDFYERVLGFAPIKRPGSFDFNGAWWVLTKMMIPSLPPWPPSYAPKSSSLTQFLSFLCFALHILWWGEVRWGLNCWRGNCWCRIVELGAAGCSIMG